MSKKKNYLYRGVYVYSESTVIGREGIQHKTQIFYQEWLLLQE